MDTVTSPDNMQLSAVKQLRQEMKPLQLSGQLDGYGLFVYGVVLRRLHLHELTIPALCKAPQDYYLSKIIQMFIRGLTAPKI